MDTPRTTRLTRTYFFIVQQSVVVNSPQRISDRSTLARSHLLQVGYGPVNLMFERVEDGVSLLLVNQFGHGEREALGRQQAEAVLLCVKKRS